MDIIEAGSNILKQMEYLRNVKIDNLSPAEVHELEIRIKSIYDHLSDPNLSDFVISCSNYFIDNSIAILVEIFIYFCGFIMNEKSEIENSNVLSVFINKKYNSLIHHAWNILHVLSDASPEFFNELYKQYRLWNKFYEIFHKCQDACLNGTLSEESKNLLHLCLNGLYACLILDDGGKSFWKKEEFLSLFRNYITTSDKFIRGRVIDIMTILDESKPEIFESDTDMITNKIRNLKRILQTNDEQCNKYIKKLLKEIEKLSKNDKNKNLLYECGISSVIKLLLEQSSLEYRKSALSLLRSLVFIESIKSMVKKEFISKLAELKSHYLEKNQGETKLYQECKNLFYDLNYALYDGDTNWKTNRQINFDKHIMIINALADSVIALQIYERLKEKQYNVWIERYDLDDTIHKMEFMKQAVENSLVIILIVSQKFQDDDTCRAIVEYIKNERKTFIQIKVQRDYKFADWVASCYDNLRFTIVGNDEDDQQYSDLFKKINEIKLLRKIINIPNHESLLVSYKPNTNVATNDIILWSHCKTIDWFIKIGVKNINWKSKYDGHELNFMRTVAGGPAENFYQICETTLKMTDLKDIRILYQSLRDL